MKILFFTILIGCSIQLHAQTVKDFNLKDLQNTYQTFENLKGEKLTVIDFWATWCKPCMKAIPEINKLYKEFKEKGVSFISINGDGPRSIAKVGPVSKSLQIEYTVLLDIDSTVKTQLNLSAFPTLILVNPKGKIVWIHEGYVTGDEIEMKKQIEKFSNEE